MLLPSLSLRLYKVDPKDISKSACLACLASQACTFISHLPYIKSYLLVAVRPRYIIGQSL